ncbi:MAG: hypothetical protein PWQ77_1146 [Kosmotogales bacterium]|nr:hypothetical protein [Kosmotogales bacterium]
MMKEDNIIVCRCEDVTLKDIRELIKRGYTNIEEIKRITRCGMGPCQGKNCGQIILREISMITGIPVEKLTLQRYRPPFGGIKFSEVLGENNDEK